MAVPFLRQGDYPAVQTEGNPYAEGVRELYAQLLQRLWKRRTENQAILAIGHLQATGSEIAEKDYSERTVIGGLECVSPETFSEQIAYTALGHIHKAQRVSGRECAVCRKSHSDVFCRETLSSWSRDGDFRRRLCGGH